MAHVAEYDLQGLLSNSLIFLSTVFSFKMPLLVAFGCFFFVAACQVFSILIV